MEEPLVHGEHREFWRVVLRQKLVLSQTSAGIAEFNLSMWYFGGHYNNYEAYVCNSLDYRFLYRAEQLAIAQDLEAKKGANPKAKSGTLKRKDAKSQTPKKKQYQAADQLDETSFRKCSISTNITHFCNVDVFY